MKQFLQRLLSLIFGLFLYALGISVTLGANIGYAPWEVFHAGIANVTGITMGQASILFGLLFVLLSLLLGERIGLGTVLNMILIGTFLDLIRMTGVIPTTDSFLVGVVMLIVGLFIISIGTYFYIRSAFGAGPRDSLMVAFTRRTKLPVGVCRTTLELVVALIGWMMGGQLGIGTLISVVAIGFCIQLTFKLFRFDVTAVRHQTFRRREPVSEEQGEEPEGQEPCVQEQESETLH